MLRHDISENRHKMYMHIISTLDHVTRPDNIQDLEGLDSYL